MADAAPLRRAPGLGDLLGRLLGESRQLVSDYALLLGAVLIAAVLVVTAWMALVAGGIAALLGQGASWITALLVAALINLAGAAALAMWVRSLVTEMPFTALVRQLRAQAPEEPS